MQYRDFIEKVQNRARLGRAREAVRATHATLEVLGQRLHGGAADNLAAQLPAEVENYLTDSKESQSFGLDEFFERVSVIEKVDLPKAVHHARAVISVVQEFLSQREMEDARAQLPHEYDPLFESGSEGEMG